MSTIDILVTSVLILIMFGIGVSLTLTEVREVLTKPKALIVSLLSQIILLPVIAFSISESFPHIPAYVKIGLVILAASPGGTTSGFITFLFKGNVALSIMLTSINSILTLFSIPLVVNYALLLYNDQTTTIHLPFFDTVKEIFIITAIPVALGILLRRKNARLAQGITTYAKPVLIILLGIVFILKIFGTEGEAGISKEETLTILPYALLLNVLCFLTGFLLSKCFNLGFKNAITASVESAVHNTTMAFLISGALLHNPQLGKVSLVYAMFSFWTALLFCSVLTLYNKRKA